MAQAAWPEVFKQVCGEPDFDAVKQELAQAQAGIGEIKRQILAVGASLKAGRDAIEGAAVEVHGIGQRLCALERQTEGIAASAAELDSAVIQVQGGLSAQSTLIQTVKHEAAVQAVSVTALQTGVASAQNAIATFEPRFQGIESRLDDLSCKVGGFDRSIGDLDAKVIAQSKVCESIQARVTAQSAAIESAQSEVATLTLRVKRSERRWRWLWGWCQLLPLHQPGSPPTPCSQLLGECGIGDLGQLARQSPADLARGLATQNARTRRLEEDPDEDDAAELVRHAKESLGGAPSKAS
jgi:uncharacterized coiled-coil protein SlyX